MHMKKELIGILLLVTCFSGFSQENVQIRKSYGSMQLDSLITLLPSDINYRFYYDKMILKGMETPILTSGMPLEEVLEEAFKSNGLNYFIDQSAVYIFKGSDIISEVPKYQTARKLQADEERQEQESAGYMQTKSMSEEKFITVGSEALASNGKACNIRGSIVNRHSGEPMIGATVFIKETNTGTITDVDGNFSLKLVPGNYQVTVNHMAMKEAEYGLKVVSRGDLRIELENELIELQEITVTDKRHSNVQGMMMGFDRISTKAVKEVPVVMGEKDVIKIVQMLPGVQNAGEGTSGFNVRGGTADQNMFYINKISVYNTSHLFGFFTAFSPDVISDFSLYKNNVPSKFGGRIASIFEVSTRPGNNEKFFAQGGVSPITAHVAVEGPLIKQKVSFVTSFRSTYPDWILKRMNDYDIRNSNGSFRDGTFGITADFNENNQLKAFFYSSSDKFGLSKRNQYDYSTTGGSLDWNHSFSKTLSADFSVSRSDYQFTTVDNNNISEAYQHNYSIKHTEARADFLYLLGENHRLEFGVNSIYYDLDRGEITPYGLESVRIPVSLEKEKALENALYISDEFSLHPRLNLLLGLRFSNYAMLGPSEVRLYEEGRPRIDDYYSETISFNPGSIVKTYSGIEPRAALNYRVDNNTSVKASYNRMQQYIFLLSNTIAVAPNDQWKLTDYHITPPVSDQVSVGFYHDITDKGINLSLELYQKWVKNIVEYKDGADFISSEPIETQILQGPQNARGVELMFKKNQGDLTGWVSYTYSRSSIQINGAEDALQVNNGNRYPSNFDIPNSFNLVANYRISKRWSFSSNIVYSSGRPVTLPVAAYYVERRPYLLYSARNAYRLPDYFRVDLSINLEGNLRFKKVAHSFWMLNIYNLTGRSNAYSVFYEVVDNEIQGYQLSIFARPIITLSWNFKFGNYNSD